MSDCSIAARPQRWMHGQESVRADQEGQVGERVRADSFLTLHYRVGVPSPVRERADDLVSTFGATPATLQLGEGQLSPALEARLIGLSVGTHAFDLVAGEAFGPRNPDLVQRLSKAVLDEQGDGADYVAGDVVEFNAPSGGRYAGVFRGMDGSDAIFDFNHPLAGQPVRFEVQILGIL
jgi:FKBP-type peptidyl-prolyl cis-trans isomerase SlpA